MIRNNNKNLDTVPKIGSVKKSFVWIVIGFLISLQVLFTIQTSTLGAEYRDIENKKMILEDDNQRLMAEMVGNTSLSQLKQNSEELGYVDPQYNLYINVDNFVAEASNGFTN